MSTYRSKFALFLAFSALPGCVNAAPTTEPATMPDVLAVTPSSHTPATRPTQRIISLSSAVQSEQLEHDDWELDMQSQIRFSAGTILFGQISIYDDEDKAQQTTPIVGFKQGDQTMALRIDDPRLKNAGWSYISAGPSREEFWGVLDASLDDQQGDLVLVHSTDSGKTMSLVSLPKPRPTCQFDSFCMDKNGHGRVSVYVDRTKTRLSHAGYYHYRTEDDGKTWTAAQFEPDAMVPADDAPDDTPQPAGKPSRV